MRYRDGEGSNAFGTSSGCQCPTVCPRVSPLFQAASHALDLRVRGCSVLNPLSHSLLQLDNTGPESRCKSPATPHRIEIFHLLLNSTAHFNSPRKIPNFILSAPCQNMQPRLPPSQPSFLHSCTLHPHSESSYARPVFISTIGLFHLFLFSFLSLPNSVFEDFPWTLSCPWHSAASSFFYFQNPN